MLLVAHCLHDGCERLEVVALLGDEGVPLEEGDHSCLQVSSSADDQDVCPIVRSPAVVDNEPATTENLLEDFEDRNPLVILTDPEFRNQLKAEREIGPSCQPD